MGRTRILRARGRHGKPIFPAIRELATELLARHVLYEFPAAEHPHLIALGNGG
ncbi:MAG: hypothetical protein HYT87_11085 [Nitrospirae bacterium]|nr:hypothetical protein [Nitrospirota bacterium]